ncbi:MAG: 50S ribosomal protein L11 methyltransferase [Acidobacteria bacterium]|nr:50S ribosomal protein L11 methyltransferase [Acidobacteriota bacterium]
MLIPLAGRASEDLCARLADFRVEGIEEHDDSLAVYFASADEASAAADLGGGTPEAMPDRNWSEEWQAQWTPASVGTRFFLCPAWIDAETPPGRIRLEMVPGNVFGGGDHPTTQLCLELLEEAVCAGAVVADVGAGTGILTRAARALGARAAGCDIDPASMGLVDFVGSADALAGGRFDGVIANIHAGVLREIRPELLRLLRPGGWLLLSGFLPEQAEEITQLFGPWERLRECDGWCAAWIRISV